MHQRLVLALDDLQPDVGHEVPWVVRDCLSGAVVLARSLLSATSADCCCPRKLGQVRASGWHG